MKFDAKKTKRFQLVTKDIISLWVWFKPLRKPHESKPKRLCSAVVPSDSDSQMAVRGSTPTWYRGCTLQMLSDIHGCVYCQAVTEISASGVKCSRDKNASTIFNTYTLLSNEYCNHFITQKKTLNTHKTEQDKIKEMYNYKFEHVRRNACNQRGR